MVVATLDLWMNWLPGCTLGAVCQARYQTYGVCAQRQQGWLGGRMGWGGVVWYGGLVSVQHVYVAACLQCWLSASANINAAPDSWTDSCRSARWLFVCVCRLITNLLIGSACMFGFLVFRTFMKQYQLRSVSGLWGVGRGAWGMGHGPWILGSADGMCLSGSVLFSQRSGCCWIVLKQCRLPSASGGCSSMAITAVAV